MKKISAVVVVLCMVLSLAFGSAAVFAEDPAVTNEPSAEEQYKSAESTGNPENNSDSGNESVNLQKEENTDSDSQYETGQNTEGQDEEDRSAESQNEDDHSADSANGTAQNKDEAASEQTDGDVTQTADSTADTDAGMDEAAGQDSTSEEAVSEPSEAAASESEQNEAEEPEQPEKANAETQQKAKVLEEDAASSLTFTVQPAAASVNYPEPVEFHAEVSDPDQVASWQWYYEDSAGNVLRLEGESAKTDTLTKLSTWQKDTGFKFYCTVTDKSGKTVTSDKAALTIANAEENKTVLYVGEYALEAGENLDLSKTKLGKGKVSFNKNGKDITLDSIDMNMDHITCDIWSTLGACVTLWREGNTQDRYNVILKEKNVITDNYYDADRNYSGVVMNFNFGNKNKQPLFVIEGTGSLVLKGGTNALFASGDLNIKAPITIKRKNYFNDGIYADNITIGEGVKLDLEVFGTGLQAGEKLKMEKGSEVKINTTAPYIKGFNTSKEAILAGETFDMDQSKLEIIGETDPDIIVKHDSVIDSFVGICILDEGSFAAKDSSISIAMSAKTSESKYALNFFGISANKDCDMSFASSKVDISIDSKDIYTAKGLITGGDVKITDGSTFVTNVKANGTVQGLAPEGKLTITDSNLTVTAEENSGAEAYGILCDEAVVSLADGYRVISTAKAGTAFAANTGNAGDQKKGYEAGYTSKKISLKKDTKCVLPVKNEINQTSIPGTLIPWLYFETFYDSDDTSKPAAEVTLKQEIVPEPVYTFDSSSDESWLKGSSTGLSATVKREPENASAFDHFSGIKIDGTALAADQYTAKSGSVKLTVEPAYLETLANGNHTLTMLFDDGEAETEFAVKEQIDIYVRGNSAQVTYTGESQKAAGCKASSTSESFDITKMAFADGKSAKAEGTDVGSYQMGLKADYFVYNDEYVEAVFNIREDGTLTIAPAPLTVTTGSATKTYDGKPLTKAEAALSGLVNEETATVTATGSLTEVGTSANTYSIVWETAKETNYTIQEKLGTLTVRKGSSGNVTPKPNSNSNSKSGGKTNPSNVKTGDTNNMLPWIILLIAAGCVAAVAIKSHKDHKGRF